MGRPVKNPGKIKELRRLVARLLTIKQEKKRKQKKNA
jgi:ribosomal protein L29